MAAKTKKSALIFLLVILIIMWVPLNNLANQARKNARFDHRPAVTAAVGFDNIVSDILWIELVQYYGGIRGKISDEIAQRVYDRFDRITRLDPYFLTVYKYGGLLLFEKPRKAVELLDRALVYNENPGWELPYYAGFISYMQLKDYELAIKYLQEAQKDPNRPEHIDRLLAMANTSAGRERIALEMWKTICQQSQTSHSRDLGAKFLRRLAEKIVQESNDESLRQAAQEVLNTL